MIRFICDTPTRIPARIFRNQVERAGGCYCCAFWRGVVLGAALALLFSISLAFYF